MILLKGIECQAPQARKRTIDSLDQREALLVMKGDLHLIVNGDL